MLDMLRKRDAYDLLGQEIQRAALHAEDAGKIYARSIGQERRKS